jgi:hypothetical protein
LNRELLAHQLGVCPRVFGQRKRSILQSSTAENLLEAPVRLLSRQRARGSLVVSTLAVIDDGKIR